MRMRKAFKRYGGKRNVNRIIQGSSSDVVVGIHAKFTGQWVRDRLVALAEEGEKKAASFEAQLVDYRGVTLAQVADAAEKRRKTNGPMRATPRNEEDAVEHANYLQSKINGYRSRAETLRLFAENIAKKDVYLLSESDVRDLNEFDPHGEF